MAALRTTIKRTGCTSRSAEALLVYLACQAQRAGAGRAGGVLSPERPPGTAAHESAGLPSPRASTTRPSVLITRQSVALNFDAPVTVDSLELEAYCAKGDYAGSRYALQS